MTSSLVGSEMCIRDRKRPFGPNASLRACRAVSKRLDECLQCFYEPISYTHLTLPTICSV
eukprot:139563-Prorocentrum_lima.AAC.1